ncbi:MAG: flippase-like domain-containing protein, partial [Actinobacteria bacterium]|nr:UPF0104 family protein [Actinomycetota bacterium]NIV59507.1 flippase-like domain-containing protein [Actinomycetota bacterium]NIW33826.1 flippase-like domain-containing protein [Actinomycetota bacterium]NIX26011.1 flippase-like domain-containing protein [Actinomycetota bacterium]
AGLAILAAAIAALVLVSSSERFAGSLGFSAARAASAIGRPLRLGPFDGWDDALRRFRNQTAGVLHRRWHVLTAATLISHGSLFALLLLSLRLLGVPAEAVTWEETLAAFAFVRLVTALPVTPGGIGLVEVGLTGALVLAGGAESATVAAVLVYRSLSYAIQIPVGAGCWLYWRVSNRRR